MSIKKLAQKISVKFAKHTLDIQAKISNAAVREKLGLLLLLIEHCKHV